MARWQLWWPPTPLNRHFPPTATESSSNDLGHDKYCAPNKYTEQNIIQTATLQRLSSCRWFGSSFLYFALASSYTCLSCKPTITRRFDMLLMPLDLLPSIALQSAPRAVYNISPVMFQQNAAVAHGIQVPRNRHLAALRVLPVSPGSS